MSTNRTLLPGNRDITGDLNVRGNATIVGTIQQLDGTVNPVSKVIKKSITNAQMKALNTTPIELIAAPGASKLIVVDKIVAKHQYLTAAFNDQDLTVGYDDGADLTVATIDATNFLNGVTADTTRPSIVPIDGAAVLDTSAQIENENIALTASGNPTTGGGTLDLYIWYTVITVT